jgi:hypothetical protein
MYRYRVNGGDWMDKYHYLEWKRRNIATIDYGTGQPVQF